MNEIRRGNFLSQPKDLNGLDYCVVYEILHDRVITKSKTLTGTIYNPSEKFIPLTEEWLPRLGFPKDRDTMNLLFDYIIYFERQDDNLYLCNNQTKVQCLIEWVHEAQNIKRILTGEELKYNG